MMTKQCNVNVICWTWQACGDMPPGSWNVMHTRAGDNELQKGTPGSWPQERPFAKSCLLCIQPRRPAPVFMSV